MSNNHTAKPNNNVVIFTKSPIEFVKYQCSASGCKDRINGKMNNPSQTMIKPGESYTMFIDKSIQNLI